MGGDGASVRTCRLSRSRRRDLARRSVDGLFRRPVSAGPVRWRRAGGRVPRRRGADPKHCVAVPTAARFSPTDTRRRPVGRSTISWLARRLGSFPTRCVLWSQRRCAHGPRERVAAARMVARRDRSQLSSTATELPGLWTVTSDVRRRARKIADSHRVSGLDAGGQCRLRRDDGRPIARDDSVRRAAVQTDPDLDVYGPIGVRARRQDGVRRLRELVRASRSVGRADRRRARARLTSFGRDTYAPCVARTGALLFKLQSYRTVVAAAPAAGGTTSARSRRSRVKRRRGRRMDDASVSRTGPGVV